MQKINIKNRQILGILTCNESSKVKQAERIASNLFKRLNLPYYCSYLSKFSPEKNNRLFWLKKGKVKIVYQVSNIFQNRIYFTIVK